MAKRLDDDASPRNWSGGAMAAGQSKCKCRLISKKTLFVIFYKKSFWRGPPWGRFNTGYQQIA